MRSAAAPPRRATRGAAAAADAQLRARRAWGVAACFGASGLMHEVQFVYMTGHTSGGLMLAFFCAQVPLMALEAQLGGLLRWVCCRSWIVVGLAMPGVLSSQR